MRTIIALYLFLSSSTFFSQISIDTLSLNSLGFDKKPWSSSFYTFYSKGISLYSCNIESEKMGAAHFNDKFGNSVLFSNSRGNASFTTLSLKLGQLDSMFTEYYFTDVGSVISLTMAIGGLRFCLIEEVSSYNYNEGNYGTGHYFFEDARIGRCVFKNCFDGNCEYRIDTFVDKPTIKVISDLDIHGNGIRKSYNANGELIHYSLFKNWEQVDFRNVSQ